MSKHPYGGHGVRRAFLLVALTIGAFVGGYNSAWAQSARQSGRCLAEISTFCRWNEAIHNPGTYLPTQQCIERWQSILDKGASAVVNELDTNSAQTSGPIPYSQSPYRQYRHDPDVIMPIEDCARRSSAPVAPPRVKQDPDPKKKPDKCDEPPSFLLNTEVEDGGTAAAGAYAGVSYCMAYLSNNSVYPLDCHMRGRRIGVMPGEQKHLAEGWPLGGGEKCEAQVKCEKDVSLIKFSGRWCPT